MTKIYERAEDAGVNWLIWQPVLNRHATLSEVQHSWSMIDCLLYLRATEADAEAQTYRADVERRRAELKQ